MHIYFSGIGGVGIGPLAEIALDAGYKVSGSDRESSPMGAEISDRASVHIGQEDGYINELHKQQPIDWFVYTAALPANHPELLFAKNNGIKTSQRDELLAHIIDEKKLKLIAISGTHGKTTTTAMVVWLMNKIGVPISYSIGSLVSFGPSGHYDPASEYFVYECDEFNRNFLHFHPYFSVITSLDYDHPDTYPTVDEYKQAFSQFVSQSEWLGTWQATRDYLKLDETENVTVFDAAQSSSVQLAGEHNRQNAVLAIQLVSQVTGKTFDELVSKISDFPGTARRFEKLDGNLYSDYAHHPAEIAATLQMASELSEHVVAVYQPHQNTRQHELKDQYTDCFSLAEKVYWLPTYLSREDPNLELLSVEKLTTNIDNSLNLEFADLDDALWAAIEKELSLGKLVLLMGAGSIDNWARNKLMSRFS